jgi:crotonobetainyl-CoA:carnitine CoA-transferase CaiB-like acyl-CoA transferase
LQSIQEETITMQPLKGLTVVTLEHAIAAPFATRQLADLGARVIHSDTILAELGYSPTQIEALHAAQAV